MSMMAGKGPHPGSGLVVVLTFRLYSGGWQEKKSVGCRISLLPVEISPHLGDQDGWAILPDSIYLFSHYPLGQKGSLYSLFLFISVWDSIPTPLSRGGIHPSSFPRVGSL